MKEIKINIVSPSCFFFFFTKNRSERNRCVRLIKTLQTCFYSIIDDNAENDFVQSDARIIEREIRRYDIRNNI